ncbi:hypothetical protein ACUL41_08275 [Virgibacillus natechei]
MPPHGRKYILVGIRKHNNYVGLVVLLITDDEVQRREYSWSNVPNLYDEEFKKYILSMKEGIEAGVYAVALLVAELDGEK